MTVYYGFDTANYIYNVASSAKAKWGTGVFYARYLNPSPGANNITSSSGDHEFHTGWTYGVRYFMPITEPSQSRLNGTSAQGQSDAAATCTAMESVYYGVGPMVVQSTNRIDVFLCLESSTNMSTAYWNGWSGYIDAFNFAGMGLILYPGMYCNPGSSARNCSSAAAGNYCFSVWPNEHEYYSDCKPFGTQTWAGETCSGTGPSTVWQFDEQGVCQAATGTSWPNVDADRTNGNHNAVGYMFHMNSQPAYP